MLRDVIAIPERAGTEDYVLKLTEGVGQGRLDGDHRRLRRHRRPGRSPSTRRSTSSPHALKDGASRAAFLAGSFGSGKSHFMAVLYALLGHNPTARAKPELAPSSRRTTRELQGKKILRLAFHFLDAQSIEQCVLGGYVAPDRRAAPGRSAPGRSPERRAPGGRREPARRDGRRCLPRRTEQVRCGDGSAAGSVWGNVLNEGNWTAASYDAARAAAPGQQGAPGPRHGVW